MISLLTIEQLAGETQESIGVWRKRVLRRQIPYVKLGRNVRIRREDLDAFVRARRVAPGVSQ